MAAVRNHAHPNGKGASPQHFGIFMAAIMQALCWNYGGGRVLRGLVLRRQAERGLL
jgi:hypothetical protein